MPDTQAELYKGTDELREDLILNINLQNYYNDALQYNIKGDGSGTQNAVNSAENIDVAKEVNLKDLLVGDVFSGKIINITNHEVNILLDNNQQLNATMQQALELNIGDKMLFQVKDKNDSQILIRPVANNEVSMDLVNKSLLAAGLSMTDKNIAIVKELIGSEQPIDKQSILNMIKLTARFGSENIDKLIDMTKNGIEVNENNLKMYDVYMQSKHQITSNINDIQNNIIKYMTDIPDNSQNNESSFSEILNNKIDSNIELLSKLSDIFDEYGSNRQESFNNDAGVLETEIKENVLQDNNVKDADSQETIIKDNDIHNTDIHDNLNVKENSENITKDSTVINNDNSAKNDNLVENKDTVQEHNIINGDNDNSGKDLFDKVVNKELSEKLNSIEKNSTNPIEKAESFKDLGDILKKLSEDGLGKDEMAKLIQSDKFSRKLTDIFEKKLFINPDKLSEDKEKIKDEVNKLYEKLDRLSESIKESIQPAKNGNLADSASNLRNNMSFMNELNHIESYVQLPVKFSEGKANGDLYVYNKKRNKYNKGDVLTAFLHLDMQYLGATDVNIKMEKKNVITKFTLADDESMEIVSSHLDELIKKIQKLGYIVNISTEVSEKASEEKSNPLQPITENNEKAVSVKRYTLDIRT